MSDSPFCEVFCVGVGVSLSLPLFVRVCWCRSEVSCVNMPFCEGFFLIFNWHLAQSSPTLQVRDLKGLTTFS